jgi:hypothetical protein
MFRASQVLNVAFTMSGGGLMRPILPIVASDSRRRAFLRNGATSLPHNGSQLVDNAPYPYRLRA